MLRLATLPFFFTFAVCNTIKLYSICISFPNKTVSLLYFPQRLLYPYLLKHLHTLAHTRTHTSAQFYTHTGRQSERERENIEPVKKNIKIIIHVAVRYVPPQKASQFRILHNVLFCFDNKIVFTSQGQNCYTRPHNGALM